MFIQEPQNRLFKFSFLEWHKPFSRIQHFLSRLSNASVTCMKCMYKKASFIVKKRIMLVKTLSGRELKKLTALLIFVRDLLAPFILFIWPSIISQSQSNQNYSSNTEQKKQKNCMANGLSLFVLIYPLSLDSSPWNRFSLEPCTSPIIRSTYSFPLCVPSVLGPWYFKVLRGSKL